MPVEGGDGAAGRLSPGRGLAFRDAVSHALYKCLLFTAPGSVSTTKTEFNFREEKAFGSVIRSAKCLCFGFISTRRVSLHSLWPRAGPHMRIKGGRSKWGN